MSDYGIVRCWGAHIVSFTSRPRSVPQENVCSVSDIHLSYRLNEPEGLMRFDVLGKLKKFEWSHGVWNPLPSGSLHSVWITTL
jgi:hypothetical protein